MTNQNNSSKSNEVTALSDEVGKVVSTDGVLDCKEFKDSHAPKTPSADFNSQKEDKLVNSICQGYDVGFQEGERC